MEADRKYDCDCSRGIPVYRTTLPPPQPDPGPSNDNDASSTKYWCFVHMRTKVDAEQSLRDRSNARMERVHDRFLERDLERLNLYCERIHRRDVYLALFKSTKDFARGVQDWVDAIIKIAPKAWVEVAGLIVEYFIMFLRTNIAAHFASFLPSERGSLCWILDNTLLKICLDRWEDAKCITSWDRACRFILEKIARSHEELVTWNEDNVDDYLESSPLYHGTRALLSFHYFEQSREFLNTSSRLYEIWRTVRMSRLGQLPPELAGLIIEDIFEYESLPREDIRFMYLKKGKEKALLIEN